MLDYVIEVLLHSPYVHIEQHVNNQAGVIAQDLEKILPQLVKQPDSENEYKSVNYTGLIPYLISAIQEQQAQIEDLKAEVEALKK